MAEYLAEVGILRQLQRKQEALLLPLRAKLFKAHIIQAEVPVVFMYAAQGTLVAQVVLQVLGQPVGKGLLRQVAGVGHLHRLVSAGEAVVKVIEQRQQVGDEAGALLVYISAVRGQLCIVVFQLGIVGSGFVALYLQPRIAL